MLGKRLKELRMSRGLSLRALAATTGLSATLLSQIEREVTEPSLTTLRRLSNVFGESMSALFADPSAPSVWISRPGERTTLMGPKGGVSYERLTQGNGQMEVLRAVFQPGQFSSEQPLRHPALESVYVLRGTLSVMIGDLHYVVNAGENIAFDANAAHRYINEGQEAVEILMSITPPVP
ncbi:MULTISPECIES: helix-turn-helix domain-containing protein [unclassified Serratia (in: enterobacteria)]|uniref:helix-turn-helix domain-containing protein n=1 Tax=unclassified Serratia (in: enterobacteria) TaxID=2647522 RepID=UPI0004FF74A9|nr:MULTISPECIES: XRE family transcriptional regulator [unclassified Serratia (in: enterobacteria)]KFK95694.1 XRE family transcriptional regulator [Serratia sp. Ag2]KFK95962.1 XRE family transcriptional regulator [Serratia sp. Ag1]